MEVTNLIKILHGDLSLIDKVNVRDVALFNDEVTIYPHDLKKMLLDFLSGKYDADDLYKWAKFIVLRGEYANPGDVFDDELMDFYEDMRSVIECLSCPVVEGEITEARVKEYLSWLDKYGDE